MILHDASSGTLVHGVSFFFFWHHCHPGDIVILLWVTPATFCPAYTSSCCNRSLWFGVVSICGLGEVLLRENLPAIFICPVQMVTSPYTVEGRSVPEDCYIMLGHSCHNNGETMVPFRHIFTFVLLFCLMFSSESPPAYSHSSKYAVFEVSLVGIHNTCSNAICGAFPSIWVSKSAGVAQLPPCYRKLLDETVKTFIVFPVLASSRL